jgi:clathrin heavy chain
MLSLAARTLKIFNIETRQKFKSHSNNEDITFRKWVSDTTIGMVKETSVYHWTNSDQTSPPQKIFDRHPTLAGAQIIHYRVTPDEKWFVLIVWKSRALMQLYSREQGVS